ncbi:GH25 family lysozyme [Ahrensia sp. R2A130]|uniref:GH25 family lysozyme n=1 Tax=Ahrensia sp. R2A130 TaxID=744979 RepID=UPI0001E0A4B6|nr:GH25 family lysozyme [Ahrensia sp. R2A130]EFL88408.1 glycosyl hydrolase/lysozyme [Ahrensia sp. R2A130]
MKLSSRLSLLALVPVVALSACTEETYSLEKAVRVQTTSHLKYGDFDPVKIKGKQPSDFVVHGIDISRYNPAVNWRTIKREGIDFAFVKATEGKDDVDPSFSKWWQQAGASGIPRSAYHFYYFCATPEAQAANYIRTVPKSQRSLPPILDVEWNPSSPSCKGRPAPAKVRAVLAKWLTIIEAHYGQKPIIYTTVDFHAENLSNGELPGYQYWLRSVKAEPKYIYGSRPWTFWQYTGTGKIRGIEGPVDINAWNGSRSQWNTWLKRNRR